MNKKAHKRTLSCLRQIALGVFELTEPDLLYQTSVNAKNYLTAKENDLYKRGFHEELEYGFQDKSALFTQRKQLRLISLGPAYPEYELAIVKAALEAGIDVTVVVVDVNPTFLDVATMALRKLLPAQNVIPLCTMFEEINSHNLSSRDIPNTYVIGPSFMNWSIPQISKMLSNMMTREGDCAVVASELITRGNDIDKILTQYNNEAVYRFSFSPLDTLGFKINQVESKAEWNEGKRRIELTHTFNQNAQGTKAEFKKGDKIITAISHRYTATELYDGLSEHFEKVSPHFWASNTAIAIVEKPKFILPDKPNLIV